MHDHLSASKFVGENSTGRCDKDSHSDLIASYSLFILINVLKLKINFKMSRNPA